MQSSVWAFGVTLWEILTLCRQKPLAHVPDHQIVTLAEKYGSTATSQVKVDYRNSYCHEKRHNSEKYL